MFGKSITLFRIFGFTVRLDLSWLLVMGLVVWSLAGAVFPERFEGLHWGVYLLMGVAAAVGLLVSIVFHELCHSLVARQYGLPMRGITLFLFGGMAEMSEEPPSARAEFMMSIAGPISSFFLAALFLGLFALNHVLGWPAAIGGVFKWIGFINILLGGFNLIPGFPLDGGRVLRAVIWHFKRDLRRATQIASRVGAAFGAVLIGMGFIYLLLLLNPLGGLWWILIGMFLRSAAKQGYRQVLIREALRGEPIRRFMNDQPVTVSGSLPVRDLVEDYVYRYHFKMFPVVEDGRLTGCVTTREIKDVPREEWDQRTVADVQRPCSEENTIRADEDAMNALSRMTQAQVSRMMVTEDNHLAGVLTLKDLLRFLSLKLDLEMGEGTRPRGLELPDEEGNT